MCVFVMENLRRERKRKIFYEESFQRSGVQKLMAAGN